MGDRFDYAAVYRDQVSIALNTFNKIKRKSMIKKKLMQVSVSDFLGDGRDFDFVITWDEKNFDVIEVKKENQVCTMRISNGEITNAVVMTAYGYLRAKVYP